MASRLKGFGLVAQRYVPDYNKKKRSSDESLTCLHAASHVKKN